MSDLPATEPVLSPSLFEVEATSYYDAERMSRPSLSYWKDAIRRYKTNKIALGSLFVLLFVILMAVFIPVFSSYTYDKVDYGAINQSPGPLHIFGTDELGRDIFVRCWEGARVSLYIAFVAVVINGLIGILYGGIAGFFGGIIDNLLMRICELIASIPQMLWVILLILIMKPGIMPVIVAISATGWIPMARLFRGQVFQIKEMEFVMASRTLGATPLWIILKHLLPNAMSPIIVTMTFSVPNAIFAEAFLSYIGLGLPLPLASWGTLASDGANKLLTYPYQLLFPSLLICITMLCFNIMGDALRDSLDPRLRQ